MTHLIICKQYSQRNVINICINSQCSVPVLLILLKHVLCIVLGREHAVGRINSIYFVYNW